MATKKKELERIYNVPLRKETQKAANWKRTKKAVTVLKEFLKKHMKSEDIKIGKHLNEHLWKHGIKNPPHHVKVIAIKDQEGVVKAELEGFKYEDKKDKKDEKKKSVAKPVPAPKPKTEVKKEKEETPKKETEIKKETGLEKIAKEKKEEKGKDGKK